MKQRILGAVLGCMVVAAGPLMAGDAKAITSEAEFRKTIAGKKLFTGDDYVRIRRNGTFVGNYSGVDVEGAWEWRDRYWCRTTKSGNTDCQVWSVDGETFILTRKRGKGQSFTYTK